MKGNNNEPSKNAVSPDPWYLVDYTTLLFTKRKWEKHRRTGVGEAVHKVSHPGTRGQRSFSENTVLRPDASCVALGK